MNEECKYIVRGNLCSYSQGCEDKLIFSKIVQIDGYSVYGVCDKASCF